MSAVPVPTVSFDLEGGSIVRDEDCFIPAVLPSVRPYKPHKRVNKDRTYSVGEKLLRPRDHECHDEIVNPGRPKFLGKLLDGLKKNLVDGEAKYKDFVARCETIATDAKSFDAMSIQCTLKYIKPATKSDHEEYETDDNSSAVYAFMFYASMQQAGSTSFQATELANETLSYYELDKFCRDFDIVPKLLTKAEVKMIWQDFIAIYVQTEGGSPPQALNFVQFKDMFVRLALFAYNKVGMKRMILAVTGFFPSAEDLVSALCDHCHFNDFTLIQKHVRNVGRETQGALNFRSSDDNNNRARSEIRIDLRAKHLARVSDKENKDKEGKEKKQQEKMNSDSDNEHFNDPGKKKLKTVQYGLWAAHGGKIYEQGGSMFNFHKKGGKKKGSNLPEAILDMLDADPSDSHNEKNSDIGEAVAADMRASVDGSCFHSLLDQDLHPDTLMTYDKATAIAKKKGTRIECIADQYDKSLVDVLSKYSRTDPAPEKSGVVESGGPYLDAGHLPPGTQCSLILSITNLTLDILQLDVSCIGFDDENTRVTISPNPVVSGIKREGQVTFSMPSRHGSRIAFVSVGCVGANGLHHTMKIPVYYRSDGLSVNQTLLTKKTLPKLCETYLGRKFRSFDEFVKKRANPADVAWVRPQSAAALRRSVQEMRPTSARATSAIASLSKGTIKVRPKSGVHRHTTHGLSHPNPQVLSYGDDITNKWNATDASKRRVSQQYEHEEEYMKKYGHGQEEDFITHATDGKSPAP